MEGKKEKRKESKIKKRETKNIYKREKEKKESTTAIKEGIQLEKNKVMWWKERKRNVRWIKILLTRKERI